MKRLTIMCLVMVAGAFAIIAIQLDDSKTEAMDQRPGGGAGEGGFVILPEDFLDDPNVPHDSPAGADANLVELGQFAWREFIALCWPAKIPTEVDPRRAMPDNTKPFWVTDPELLVWETYQHKAEMFPSQSAGEIAPAPFDTFPPVYKYASTPLRPIVPSDPTSPLRTQWNNLDESNEISRCVLYAHSNEEKNSEYQIFYEAKVNRVFYDYIAANKLYATSTREKVIGRNTDQGLGEYDLLRYGSRCDETPPTDLESTTRMILVQFPCGSIGSEREGAIEVKPAWRKLTEEEASSGRYYMNTVQYYESEEGSPDINVRNETFGLVALHIIQKTKSFPSFCYATWEQVDNASSGLRYENLPPRGTIDGGEFPVERRHGIPSAINAVNTAVHRLIKSKNPKSVWQHYRLIGVQANATDPPGPEATQDEISTFNLANLVVETNEELQSFAGRLGPLKNQNLPSVNTFRLGRSFNAGGCLGCHGFQGQFPGYDFSVIAAKGPVTLPEPQELGEEEMRTLNEELLRLGNRARLP